MAIALLIHQAYSCVENRIAAIVLHRPSLQLYTQTASIFSSINAIWINTWGSSVSPQLGGLHGAAHLQLQETTVAPDFSMFDDIGISKMRLLSPELIHIIYEYSASSLIWRYNSASELTRILPTLSSQPLSVPLCTATAWDRGGQLTTSKAINQLPVLRLTIGSWGIQKVERLSQTHPFGPGELIGSSLLYYIREILKGSLCCSR